MAELMRRYRTKEKWRCHPLCGDNIFWCVKVKMSWAAQMKAKMVADEFQKVREREAESEADCGWSWDLRE